ncbi:MAG: hypothetical protein IJZ82_07210 [Lachnospiraceae bacterium]|nr:hypothetical protein [Lachnospiraceae bacterium]
MKEFVTPTLIDLDINETAEGMYAGSGSHNDDPTDVVIPSPEPGDSCWVNWKCTWTGHNNGSHSVCNVTANHCGDHSGNTLVMNFLTNFPIKEIKDCEFPVSNVGLYTFTITRTNFFNPTENIGFNFQIVSSETFYDASGNPYHGAIGENNAASYYCKVVSHYCS